MSKEEWIWTALKIFGIYLLVLTIVATADLFRSSTLFLYTYPSYQSMSKHSRDIRKFYDRLGEIVRLENKAKILIREERTRELEALLKKHPGLMDYDSKTDVYFSPMAREMRNLAKTYSDIGSSIEKTFLRSVLSDLVSAICRFFVFLAAGIYFLRRGDFVFRLIYGRDSKNADKTDVNNQ